MSYDHTEDDAEKEMLYRIGVEIGQLDEEQIPPFLERMKALIDGMYEEFCNDEDA